ncbi:hypothetical protein [Arthrobacter bambusae]|uniref:hypothetical protein n=1 Tax=Arthrobacter bambusae TaxID=1338426 RepID=UPI002787591F|nr:hypothetical protein [Arthrobacter bambusae]MDQ0028595.1 hypothetical protein [Arthrobacter bambusae]MDQ0096611.1 hypothetical protein [Arthrobacter bambusae]
MATTQQDKETTTSAQSGGNSSSGNAQESAGTTITIPSLQSMIPGSDAFEPKHLLWFGGLAVAGVMGVLEWPVVAAVGVGSYVAERFARSATHR